MKTAKFDSMRDELPSLVSVPKVGQFMVRGIQQSFVDNPRPKLSSKSLTPRQREVVGLLVEGKTMKETALLLNLTPSGVAFHKYDVMHKLNLKTTADLIRFAIECGILT
jgi:two-component system nitrate/nitrite response regulator NarL